MLPDKCPWCDCRIAVCRLLGRGYVPSLEPPHVMWKCGSKQLGDSAKLVQSQKCIQNVQKEVEELRGEVQRIQRQRDNLIRFLDHEFDVNHPVVVKPKWLVVAAALRKAESEKGDG